MNKVKALRKLGALFIMEDIWRLDDTDIYWAIPIGNLNHRNEKAKERLDFYLNTEKSGIRSCFYHIGNRKNNYKYYFLYF